MTFREKLQAEHPEEVNEMFTGGCYGCPYEYDYESHCNCASVEAGRCTDDRCRNCWDREMPEEKKAEEPVEIKIEEEKKMRNLSDVIRDTVLNAISDSDIEYAVKECFESHDYSDMIERAVENYLYENIEDIANDIVTEAVRDYMRDNL